MLPVLLQGNAPFLDLVARRLIHAGLEVRPVASPWPQWNGLAQGELRVDLAAAGIERARHWAQRCDDAGLVFAEIAAHWHPAGEDWGFLAFAGAQSRARELLPALVDPLAPQPGAWLPCGPPGAAGFTARVFDALCQAGALAMHALPFAADTAPSPPDWSALLASQHHLAQMLLQLAQQYLRYYPVETAGVDGGDAVSWPIHPSPHYAQNLARLIDATLGRNAAWHDGLAPRP